MKVHVHAVIGKEDTSQHDQTLLSLLSSVKHKRFLVYTHPPGNSNLHLYFSFHTFASPTPSLGNSMDPLWGWGWRGIFWNCTRRIKYIVNCQSADIFYCAGQHCRALFNVAELFCLFCFFQRCCSFVGCGRFSNNHIELHSQVKKQSQSG